MLTWIRRKLENRRQNREALRAAVRHFEETGRCDACPGISCVLHSDASSFIVRVYYGHTKPPHRVWFRVSRDLTRIQELSFDDVRQYGERIER